MDAVTYSNSDVETFTKKHFILVRFDRLKQPEVMEQFHAFTTPTIIVQDAEGREHRRKLGYLDPQSFLGELSP